MAGAGFLPGDSQQPNSRGPKPKLFSFFLAKLNTLFIQLGDRAGRRFGDKFLSKDQLQNHFFSATPDIFFGCAFQIFCDLVLSTFRIRF